MVRLGLDASQRITSCAVSTDHGVVAALTMDKPIENFTILIRKTLLQAKVRLEDLAEIVVCIGPGSQMGVRTTVVTGNALALALGVPITGVLSTDAIATASPVHKLHHVAVSAGRRRWYVTKYNWDGDKLLRLDKIQLLDEIPVDNCPTLRSDTFDFDRAKMCASGILMVVEQQKHLITQSMVSEVAPYDQGESDG